MEAANVLGDVEIQGKIRLRLVVLIHDLLVDPPGELVINVGTPRTIEVTYRRPNATELERGSEWSPPLSLGNTICVASAEWNVSDRNRDALAKLAREGVDLSERFVVFGSLAGTGMPAWDAMPPGLQEMLHGAANDLERAARHTFRLLRWYLALPGDHDPFFIWSCDWSPDGSRWQSLPRKVQLKTASAVPTLKPIPWFPDTIEKAVKEGRDEPIAHEMLREATHHLSFSPRSALVIGIAAAEIGFEEFVASKVPAASWLVTEAPTPPLIAMLTSYLPDLLAQLNIRPFLQFVTGKDKNKDFNDPVLRELQRGITMRNRLVHKPSRQPSTEDVEPVLVAVQDLLGMLDYYSGGVPLGGSFIRRSTHGLWSQRDANPA